MPMELIEVRDTVSFYRVAKNANIILRIDPLLIVPLYRLTFYLDIRNIDESEVAKLFQSISNKLVYIEDVKRADSLKSFIEERYGD